LMAEALAERHGARFTAEKCGFRLEFPITDFNEAERQQRSLLLISADSEDAFRIAELLRRNGHEVVVGPEELVRSADYRFDAAVALQEITGSLSRPADVVFRSDMNDQEVLAAVSAFFAPRV
jgi:hypothetical protein